VKANLIAALHKFINQRPGLEFGNYGDVKTYRAEVRSIGKDLREARQLLRAVELRDTITADDIIKASQGAYSGRLTITPVDGGGFRLDYCTGQYFPTEYRRAVCAVLSSALWDYWRDHCMPKPFNLYGTDTKWYAWKDGSAPAKPISAGDYLRNTAKRELGRSLAARWFR
jgi:hypothetical protein